MAKGTYAQAFGTRLKSARLQADLTQEELAGMVQLAKDTLSRYERGSMAPGAEAVLRLAQACKTDPLWLLSGQMPRPVVPPESTAVHFALDGLSKAVDDMRGACGLPPLGERSNHD